MKLLLVVLTFMILSCATGPKAKSKAQNKIVVKPQQFNVYNGKVKFMSFAVDYPDGVYKLACYPQIEGEEIDEATAEKKEMPVKISKKKLYLYYAENYHSIVDQQYCYLAGQHIITMNVKQYPYKEERLRVDKSKVVLSEKDQKRVEKEWEMTQKLYKNSIQDFLIDKPFKLPLNSYITSRYGKRRIFNNLKKTQHLGNDFRAAVGVPIPASNRGKVVFTGNLFYTGNVVIIDHGMNIFSLYAHLSKFKVTEGSVVEQGQIVGLAGRTGRVSGPHLHWGIKLNGNNIDGFSLVKESKNQFVSNASVK